MVACCGDNWAEVERHLMEQEATRKINEEARIENERQRQRLMSEIDTNISSIIEQIELLRSELDEIKASL